MNSVLQNYKALFIIALIALVALASTVVIIPETHQAVVIRTGQPHRVLNQFRPDQPYGQTGAGINWRIPIAEQVQMVDRRVLDLDMTRQQVLSNDQQRLQVDAYARYRIIDPV
ncbi:MAG TPA: SPFH domain-containing protein, partial [Erythrobacter sp.]|nr:SPFH domain-containing protein [Erythrobacter sp.]